MIGWLLACAQGTPWTEKAAFEPVVRRLDRDGNGRLEQDEYEEVTTNDGPPFGKADRDRDGAISAVELRELALEQDPLAWYQSVTTDPQAIRVRKQGKAAAARPPGGGPGGPPPGGGAQPGPGANGADGPAGGPGPSGGPGAGRSVVWMTLTLLREEVLARDPVASVPDDAALLEAGATQSLESAPSQAVLAQLKVASTKVGLGFPDELLAGQAGAPNNGQGATAAPAQGAVGP